MSNFLRRLEGYDRCRGCQDQHEYALAERTADGVREEALGTLVDIARGQS